MQLIITPFRSTEKMGKKWFQLAEEGAGNKRLLLTKYIYDLFGEIPVRIIAFFVVLSVFIKAKERRRAVEKFCKLINKPPFFGAFRLFFNYGNSLVDKFISFLGKLNPDKFILDNRDIYKGAFFITTHIGNVEILRTLFQSDKFPHPKRVNVFLQSNACTIFNNFLKTLQLNLNIDVFPVENIDAETSILISERLQNGEPVFMAGDRVSAQNVNKVYEADFLGKKIKLPLGTLKFALMLNCPIYFIVCAKEGNKYIVHTQKFQQLRQKRSENLEDLKEAYAHFLEEYALKYPYQFYHFHDITE